MKYRVKFLPQLSSFTFNVSEAARKPVLEVRKDAVKLFLLCCTNNSGSINRLKTLQSFQAKQTV